jgi:hypothetical protein
MNVVLNHLEKHVLLLMWVFIPFSGGKMAPTSVLVCGDFAVKFDFIMTLVCVANTCCTPHRPRPCCWR